MIHHNGRIVAFLLITCSFLLLGVTIPTSEKAMTVHIVGGYADGTNRGIILDRGYINGITEGTTGRLCSVIGGAEIPFVDFRMTHVYGETSVAEIVGKAPAKIPESGTFRAVFSDLKAKLKAPPVSDDFNSLDSNLWHKADWALGDTAFPGSGDSTYVRTEEGDLALSFSAVPGGYAGDSQGKRYIGGHVFSDPSYGYGSYRAEIMAPSTAGLIIGFFIYNKDLLGKADEIDVEIITSRVSGTWGASSSRPDVLFSTWNNWDESLGYGTGDYHQTHYLEDVSFDPTDGYHTYGFDWYKDRVEFFIDGRTVKTIDKAVPQPPASIMMNIWANDEWTETGYPPSGDATAYVKNVMFTPYKVDADTSEGLPLTTGKTKTTVPGPQPQSKIDISSLLSGSGGTNRPAITGGAMGTAYTVLLIDISNSMSEAGKIDQAKGAALDYLKKAGPTERIALMTFNTGTDLVGDFNQRRDVIKSSVIGLRTSGKTALIDSVMTAMELLSKNTAGRKVVLVVTDGMDNASSNNIEKLNFTALKNGVEIITVPVGSETKGLDLLRSMSEGSKPVRPGGVK